MINWEFLTIFIMLFVVGAFGGAGSEAQSQSDPFSWCVCAEQPVSGISHSGQAGKG
jgi:hypothetical protein